MLHLGFLLVWAHLNELFAQICTLTLLHWALTQILKINIFLIWLQGRSVSSTEFVFECTGAGWVGTWTDDSTVGFEPYISLPENFKTGMTFTDPQIPPFS